MILQILATVVARLFEDTQHRKKNLEEMSRLLSKSAPIHTMDSAPASPKRKGSSKAEEPFEVLPLPRSAKKSSSARKKLPLNDEDDGAVDEQVQRGGRKKAAASSSSSSSSVSATAPSTPSRSTNAAASSAASIDAGTPAKLVLSGKKGAAAASLLMPDLSPVGSVSRTVCLPEVQAMYKVVHKCTGSLGGNGSGGAIYGELTQSSMQRVVNLMQREAGLDSSSVFIDVGAGLGKPNMHVAIDPAVRYSVGVEMEHVRWLLSMHNLKHYLEAPPADPEIEKPANVAFMHGDIIKAKSFDPFTHIYMFDIGFPPALFMHIAECLRKSSTAKYVLCYHRPQLMLKKYGFDMEFIEKQATSMHGTIAFARAILAGGLYDCFTSGRFFSLFSHRVVQCSPRKQDRAKVTPRTSIGAPMEKRRSNHARLYPAILSQSPTHFSKKFSAFWALTRALASRTGLPLSSRKIHA